MQQNLKNTWAILCAFLMNLSMIAIIKEIAMCGEKKKRQRNKRDNNNNNLQGKKKTTWDKIWTKSSFNTLSSLSLTILSLEHTPIKTPKKNTI